MNPNNQENKLQQSEPEKQTTTQHHSTDHVPYPKLDPNDVAPPPPPVSDNWTSVPVTSQQPPVDAPRSSAAPEGGATTLPLESNPYVSPAPVPASSMKNTMDSVKDVLGKWGKKAAEASKKAGDLAGNTWQHCLHDSRRSLNKNVVIPDLKLNPDAMFSSTSSSLTATSIPNYSLLALSDDIVAFRGGQECSQEGRFVIASS